MDRALKKKGATAGGFKWAYEDEYTNGWTKEGWQLMENKVDALKQNKLNSASDEECRTILQIDVVDLSVIARFKNYKEAAREIGGIPNNIKSVLDRVSISSRKSYWVYEDEYSKDWGPKARRTKM